MEHYQVDPASGATLIGGDMLGWSDLSGARVPTAARELVAPILADPSKSVILVGPTASLLLDDMDRANPVSVLVRGVPDARSLQTRSGLHSDLTVYCGALERFTPAEPADLVISLDSRDRLLTPDSPPTTQSEVVGHLASLARAGGTLLISVRNPLGLDALAGPVESDPDHAWHRAGGGFDRWAYYPEVPGLLEDAGLRVRRQYAGYPAAAATSVVVAVDADGETVQRAGLFAEQHAVDHYSRHPAMSDPVPLVHRLFRSRMHCQLAPVWLLVADRGEAPVGQWPDLVVAESGGSPLWDLTLSARDGEVQARPDTVVHERRIGRDAAAVAAAQPSGDLLDILLRQRCADHDVTDIRELVQSYARWLTTECPEDRRVFATPDNVVQHGDGTLSVFDPSWHWTGDLDPTTALARGLRHFAGRLVSSGAEHPWTSNASPDSIAQTLMQATGESWAEDLLKSLAQLEGEITATVAGLTADEERHATKADSERGRNELVALPGLGMGYRESLRKVAELAQQLRLQDQKVEWLERHLEWRDRQYAMLEKRTDAVQATVGYRTANALAAPKRIAVRKARRAVVSQLPPGFKEKAEKAARRMLKDQ